MQESNLSKFDFAKLFWLECEKWNGMAGVGEPRKPGNMFSVIQVRDDFCLYKINENEYGGKRMDSTI